MAARFRTNKVCRQEVNQRATTGPPGVSAAEKTDVSAGKRQKERTILLCPYDKEIITSLAAGLSNVSSANKSCAADGQTEMTASLCHQTNPSDSVKSFHGAINVIVSYDMYEISNNAALP